ncbi:MAG: hypothetical protein Q8R92_19370 [Deltaproteobacteria bacterium]|nr:hypothetical protein [Deltaproteobacteria bacterium]
MRFSDILGQERPLEILRRATRAGRVAHAYLFQGPGGVGKRRAADAFAAALLCDDPAGEEACGSCASCVRFGAGTHPDLHVLEIPEGKSRIPIDRFHAIEAELQLASHGGRQRVAIVDPADALSFDAQHAFLKTLEEPGAGTVFILVTARPSALVGTILSRCQSVGFGPIPDAPLRRALAARADIDPKQVDLLAGIARGSLGRALALGKAGALPDRDALFEVEGAAQSGVLGPALAWAEGVRGTEEGRARALAVLDLLLLKAHDVMVLASGGLESDLAHRDRVRAMQDEARVPGAADRAARAFTRILRAQQDIRRNVTPALALQGLFADLAGPEGRPGRNAGGAVARREA